ncbi:MAG TPA: hypothetical protein VLV86_16320 [Vicinamibacterales bacterium]|nr:hypothetical protein [Vicinamibacterales bacterium]
MKKRTDVIVCAIAVVAAAGVVLNAQRGRGAAPTGGTPKAAAPVDFTGTWVSIVSEDWLQRMLMPPRGDYAGVPLTLEGRRVANLWEPANEATDGCKPYGAPAVMRVPGRLKISWENDTTLKIETDAGMQTRLLHFDQPKTPVTERSWQGDSHAEWEQLIQRGGQGGGLVPPPPRAGAALKVVTTKLRAGYLRKNGVPYSEDAVLTEYFDRISEDENEWLLVETIVNDPKYLSQDFITSTHFRREADSSKWTPTSCESARGKK